MNKRAGKRIKPSESRALVVVVGSRNPAKLRGALRALRRLTSQVELIEVDVEGETSPQPVGLEETVKAALRRAEAALDRAPEASLALGIEAGLVRWPLIPSCFMDQHVAIVMDREGRVTVGGSASFQYPSKVVLETLGRGVEVGVVMEKVSGVKGIGRKGGAVGFLSHGAVSREILVEHAVVMAMIPRLNPELYSQLS